jgi:hypothetical protein
MRLAWILVVAGCGFQSPRASTDGAGGADGMPAAPDAGFDYALCPASYNAALPGPSRYRLITDGHRAWEQSDACNQDLPAATHLVAIDSPEELAAVKTFVAGPGPGLAGNALWIGGVQSKTAALPADDWFGFDGQPLINGWSGGEPNDRGGTEGNHEEQFVKMQKDKPYFIDTSVNDILSALCECDGKPIAATAAAAITAGRPPS